MPLLRKGIIMPVRGVDFSQPATFIDDRSGFPTNMRYFRSELRKRPGKSYQGLASSDSTQIMGMARLDLSSGLSYLVRNSKAKMDVYNTGTEHWDSIASSDFTGTNNDFFSYTTVSESDLLIITNGFDSVKKWGASGNISNLGGSPPLAKYCCYLSPYLLLGHVTDSGDILPWAIDWSDTGNPENFTTGNSGRELLSDEPSPIQNIAKLNEFVAAYKKESLWIGRKVDTSDIFLFDCIKTGIGLGAPRAFAEAEGQHYFMSQNDFYVWNGVREDPIGKSVRDEVFSRINREKIDRCFSLHVQELNEIWFFIVVTGYDWPTEIWKYNYRIGFWYFDTCSELTSATKWMRINTTTWDDLNGTWDEWQGTWDSGASSVGWENISFGDKTGFVQLLDYTTTNDLGVAVNSFFITKDFSSELLEYEKRWLQIDLWGKGVGNVYVDYSIDEGDSWVNIPFKSSQAYIDMDGVYRKYELFFDVIAPQIRFRFRNNGLGETLSIRNFYPYYLSKEPVYTKRS